MTRTTVLVSALVVLAFLAGCKPSEEEKTRVQGALPDGCVLIDLGSYGEIDRLVMIRCEGRDTVSMNTADRRSSGKTTTNYQGVTFTIEG